MDGQLVLGGYDAAKVTGPNVTQKLMPPAPGCSSGMYVTVVGMILDLSSGITADMLAPSTLSACIAMDFPDVLSFRRDPYWYRFTLATGIEGNDGRSDYPWDVAACRLMKKYVLSSRSRALMLKANKS